MIVGSHRRDTCTHFAHDPGAFVTQDAREFSFAVQAIERVGIGMTNTRRHDLHQHFASLRALQIKLDNLKRLFGFKCYGCTGLHNANFPLLTKIYYCIVHIRLSPE